MAGVITAEQWQELGDVREASRKKTLRKMEQMRKLINGHPKRPFFK